MNKVDSMLYGSKLACWKEGVFTGVLGMAFYLTELLYGSIGKQCVCLEKVSHFMDTLILKRLKLKQRKKAAT